MWCERSEDHFLPHNSFLHNNLGDPMEHLLGGLVILALLLSSPYLWESVRVSLARRRNHLGIPRVSP